MEAFFRREIGAHPLLIPLLMEKGLTSPELVRAALHPDLEHLVDPESIPNLKPAVETILRTVKRREGIWIWGHEDADGFTSTAVLLRTLRFLGHPEDRLGYYIPSKREEGHGLTVDGIRKARDAGIRLIVTVDSGGSSTEEVVFAREIGVEVIITDHHEIPSKLPDTLVVNPKLGGNNFPYLAGVGVAFKVAWLLLRYARQFTIQDIAETLPELFVYTAVGTVADRVPLVSENRILVDTGADLLQSRSFPFTRAYQRLRGHPVELYPFISLISAGYADQGRSPAVEVLITGDDDTAERNLQILMERNQEWTRESQQQLEEALKRLGRVRRYVYVDLPEAQPQYLGYIASRIKDHFQLPTIVTGRRGNGIVIGEVRYPYGENSLILLNALSHLFLDYGGHRLASGFSLQARDLPEFLEELESFFKQTEISPDAHVDLEVKHVDPSFVLDLYRWGKTGVELRVLFRDVSIQDLLTLNHRGVEFLDPEGLLSLYPPATRVDVILASAPEGLRVYRLQPLQETNKEVFRGHSGRSTEV